METQARTLRAVCFWKVGLAGDKFKGRDSDIAKHCDPNSSVVYDKLLATLSLAVSEPKAKREKTFAIDCRIASTGPTR